MESEYRARATKAEQENAVLRERLAKRPKHDALIQQIKGMLKLSNDSCGNALVAKIKVLRDNQDLYKAGASSRSLTKAELRVEYDKGYAHGLDSAIEILQREING